MARRFVALAKATHKGRRPQNEDSVVTLDLGGDRFALAVADGMGGHQAGDVASQVATETFSRFITESRPRAGDRELLQDAFAAVAEAVAAETMRANQDDMGSTFVAALASKQGIHVVNVGDSPGLLVLPDRIVALTVEHTATNEALAKGEISEEEAAQHPFRHAVMRSLGSEVPTPSTKFVALQELKGREGAVLLLGSDGLLNHVREEEIRAAITGTTTLDQAAQLLVQRAIQNGSTDNVTVAMLEIQPWERKMAAGLPTPAARSTTPGPSRGLIAALLAAALVIVGGGMTFLVHKISAARLPRATQESDSVTSAARTPRSPGAEPQLPSDRPWVSALLPEASTPPAPRATDSRPTPARPTATAKENEAVTAPTPSSTPAAGPEAKEDGPVTSRRPSSLSAGGSPPSATAPIPQRPTFPPREPAPVAMPPSPPGAAMLDLNCPSHASAKNRMTTKVAEIPRVKLSDNDILEALRSKKLVKGAKDIHIEFRSNGEAIVGNTTRKAAYILKHQEYLASLLNGRFDPAIDSAGKPLTLTCTVSIRTQHP